MTGINKDENKVGFNRLDAWSFFSHADVQSLTYHGGICLKYQAKPTDTSKAYTSAAVLGTCLLLNMRAIVPPRAFVFKPLASNVWELPTIHVEFSYQWGLDRPLIGDLHGEGKLNFEKQCRIEMFLSDSFPCSAA